jgi:hypothetical protein
LAKGTVLVAEFSKSINSKKLKPGAKLEAQLTQDLVVRGKVLAPVDSKLVGHVTEVTPGSKEMPAKLGIIFDRLKLKHHKELAFLATVQILAPPSNRPRRVDQPDQMLPPTMLAGGVIGGPVGSRSSSRSSQAVASAAQELATVNNVSSTGVVVAGTPGTVMGNNSVPAKLPKPQITTNQPVSGGGGVRGVFGIRDIALGPPDQQTPGPVIVSPKSSIKLEDATQVVLLVAGPPRPAQ